MSIPHNSSTPVGIDLGTTNSVLAWIGPKGVPETVASNEGERTTPSVVFFDRDGPIVGREAAKAALHEPHRAVQFAKRDVGKRECQQVVCGWHFRPEVIEALVLRKLVADATDELGSIRRAVVTVPAYFNEPRRKATQDAGKLAGLEVLDIVNEPTAAAIAYGVHHGFLDADGTTPRRELVLVYDLGGGTFDATVMELDGSRYRTLATGGDVYLGGIDFNRRILDHLAEQFAGQYGVDPREDPIALQELMVEAEDAKRALSVRQQVTIHYKYAEHHARFLLTREQFEGLSADLLHRTLFTVKRVIREAGVAPGSVPRVLLVGGSTRMPMVRQALERELGVSIDRPLSPDEAVAHGAALYADLLVRRYEGKRAPMSVQNVNSHDLGVLATERTTNLPRRKVQIPRNTQLPAAGTHRFFTRRAGQRSVHIPVIEGGDASGRNATPIGNCAIRELPPGLPAHSPIDVVFQYSENGRLTITGELPTVGRKATLVIERAAGMSDEELAEWEARIAEGIKIADEADGGEPPPIADSARKAESDKAKTKQRFVFLCPNGHRLSAPRKKIGLEIDCPSCGEPLIIPDPDAPEEPAATADSAEPVNVGDSQFDFDFAEPAEPNTGVDSSAGHSAANADDPDLDSFLKGLDGD